MMNEHQRETAFLRQCLHYDDTAQRQELEERLSQAQRDERCVRRAVWLMALLTALAMAGLCYSAVFQAQSMSQLTRSFTSKVFCTLALGSLICLTAFVGLGAIYRKVLDQRREECRRLATKLLESRLGTSHPRPLPGAVKDRENLVNGNEAIASTSEIVKLPSRAEGVRSPLDG
jgi:hypothetical protein